jgi:23S rRNA (cytosine1962-C5)-methyltransferase
VVRSVFCANKPYGISSHQTDAHKPGFIEWLSKEKKQLHYICHRLDKITTGCFVTTPSHEDCAQVSELWSHGQVQKKYFLITDRIPSQQEWSVATPIEGKAAATHFRFLKQQDSFCLIEASPIHGRTHQIRIHAKESGVPLLGDTTYGGSTYPLIFLHCQNVRSEHFDFSSEPPLVYSDLSLLTDPLLCQWLMSYDRRLRLYPQLLETNQSLRLVHDEGTPLRVDLLGQVAHAGWWSDAPPSEPALQSVHRFFDLLKIKQWSLQNYGKSRSLENKFFIDKAPTRWTASENSITYELTKSVGAAPGLFLDQREHRQWLQENCMGKKVLNLFAYTGGFSLNAAKGGAAEVITVDLSRKYIEWSQKNFSLNQLANKSFKFYDMDSFAYLKFAAKKALTFDFIICDPPSFSRHEKTTFRVEKDFTQLIEMCLAVLSSKGALLFSTNFEQWDAAEWESQIQNKCRLQDIEFTSNFSLQWDFDWHQNTSLLKSFRLKKQS